MSEPVLRLAQARLRLAAGQVSAPLNLTLPQGALVVIDPQGADHAAAFTDACVGLVPPVAGSVQFLGRDWAAMRLAEARDARGLIGHCFTGGAWLPHLSVLENLTFAARHHRLLPASVLEVHAAQLARRFGLPGVPTGKPAELEPSDLARAALVRAFLGRPALVLLEAPRRDLPGTITQPLVQAIRRIRDRGGAVLWLTDGGELAEATLPADARYRLAGGRLVPARAEAAA